MGDSSQLSPCSEPFRQEEETDLTHALNEKRREIDHEIAQFRERKEQEFRDFEARLRQRRKIKGVPGIHLHQKEVSQRPNATPVTQTLPPQNGPMATDDDQNSSPRVKLRADDQAALSLPSPSPSPSEPSSFTGQSPKAVPSAPGSATPLVYERDRDFCGLFTPTYLKLLDAQHVEPKGISSDDLQYSVASSTVSPEDLNQKPSASLTKRNSLNLYQAKSVSPPMNTSTSLPSALRRTSSDQRPKSPKHVMFRLSDLTVVEPSSSYEELPTPNIPSGEQEIAAEITAGDGGPTPIKTSAQQHSMSRKTLSTPSNTTESVMEDEGSMFALDEDLEIANDMSTVFRQPTPVESEDEVPELDLDNDRYSERDWKSASPAAGSLPISIIRPSPRGREGGMYGSTRGW